MKTPNIETAAGHLKIGSVVAKESVAIVQALAREIWTEHYTPIIGAAQVSYMLDRFQSAPAITRQIEQEGYLYFLLTDIYDRPIGYQAVIPKPLERELFLSKIYVAREERGKGYAREAIRFLERLAAQSGMAKIALTVNRNNLGSIAAYQALGFQRVGEVVTDIGGGFVMDDYLMEKRC